MPSRVVNSQKNGIIDYDDLIRKIKEDKEKHPIIFANLGTTFKGAIDDVKKIQ
jgi:histidine decarboxylase